MNLRHLPNDRHSVQGIRLPTSVRCRNHPIQKKCQLPLDTLICCCNHDREKAKRTLLVCHSLIAFCLNDIWRQFQLVRSARANNLRRIDGIEDTKNQQSRTVTRLGVLFDLSTAGDMSNDMSAQMGLEVADQLGFIAVGKADHRDCLVRGRKRDRQRHKAVAPAGAYDKAR